MTMAAIRDRLLSPSARTLHCHEPQQPLQWSKHPFDEHPRRVPPHRPSHSTRTWSFCFDNNTRKS